VFVSKDGPEEIEPLVERTGRPVFDDGKAVVRECPRHGMIEHRQFSDGRARRWRCRRCVGEAVTRRHRKVKQTLVELAGGRCVVCGYDRTLVNLHFHHVDPATKAFGMSISSGKSLAAYVAEARKCILVCANCHGEIETQTIPCPPLTSCWPDAS
jgi:hypothetical protein